MNDKYVAKYLRISDDDDDVGEQKSESDSIANQRKVLEDYIGSHGELSQYVVKEFADDGFSGVNFNRPGIQNLLQEVKESRVACIIVKDFSRFGRNYIETGDYIEQIFPFLGVRFIAVSDNYDSAYKQPGIEVGFKNLIHDMYSRDLSRKIKSVKKLYQERGCSTGGDVPYGYQRNRENNPVYLPDSEAAEVVKTIFRLAVEGNSPVEIADILCEDGVETRGAYKNKTINRNYKLKNQKSNFWTAAEIREILKNEVYIGTYICHKMSSVSPRVMKHNDEAEYITFENAHEPLVTKEIFRQAQEVISLRGKRGQYKKDENPHALKGKLKCGYCGYGMVQTTSKSASYYCRMGNRCGSHLSVKTEVLEKAILGVIHKYMELYLEEENKKQKVYLGKQAELLKANEEKRLLEMKIGNCKANRLNLYRQWKEMLISKEEYLLKRCEYENQEKESSEKLEKVNSRITELQSELNKKGEQRRGNCFSEQTLTRELTDALIERIDVYAPDKIEIHWKVRGFEKK